jgi:hypothetical protein
VIILGLINLGEISLKFVNTSDISLDMILKSLKTLDVSLNIISLVESLKNDFHVSIGNSFGNKYGYLLINK